MSNTRLKIAIIESGHKGYELAHQLGWHPSKISQIIIGAHKPKSDEQHQLARILNKTVEELFSPTSDTVAA